LTGTRRVGTRHKRHQAQQQHHRRLHARERAAVVKASVKAVAVKTRSNAKGSATMAAGTKVAQEDMALADAILSFETTVNNGLAPAVKVSQTLTRFKNKVGVAVLVERMTLQMEKNPKKKNLKALLGIDGDATPNDNSPLSLLKSVERGISALQDFILAVNKDAALVKTLNAKSTNHKAANVGTEVGALLAKGKTLLQSLDEKSNAECLWSALEHAVHDLHDHPPMPDKIKSSLEKVITYTESSKDIATQWGEYEVLLQSLLNTVGKVTESLGKAFSYALQADVPTVAGFKVKP
jgi:hypothetical protein